MRFSRAASRITAYLLFILAFCPSLHALAASPPAPSKIALPASGLVSWFRGEGDATDHAGGNDGTPHNGAAFATGKVGRAFSFDGVDDYVSVPHQAELNPTAGFSVEAWIKASPQQFSPDTQFVIVDKSHGFADGTGWGLQGNPNGTVAFFYGKGGGSGDPSNFVGVSTLVSLLDDQWHHLVGVYDQAAFSIWLDGVLNNSLANTAPAVGNTREMEIGRAWGGGSPTRYFHGLIDEVGFYNRALSPDEVRALYGAADEGKATLIVTTSSDVVDSGDGVTSLREAIDAANASVGDRDVIGFDIPALPVAGGSRYSGEGAANDTAGPNNGSLENGTTFGPGVIGQAFVFDGVDDRIVVPHQASQNPGTQITIDAWIYQLSLGHGRSIVQKRSSGNVGGYVFETTHSPYGPDNGLSFVIWIGGTTHTLLTPPGVTSIGVWQHAAATYDGATMRIFVDGEERASMAASGAIDASSEPIVMGRNVVNPSYAWNGRIDEIEILDRPLSASEVRSIYLFGRGIETAEPSNLVSLYRAEDNANDAVGGNHATAMGATTYAAGRIGKAFDFDASSGTRVEIPDAASLRPQNLSLTAWVKARSAGANVTPFEVGPIVISKDLATDRISYVMTGPGSTGRFSFQIGLEGGASPVGFSAQSFGFGSFHHLALTWDGSNLRGYVDGNLETELAVGPATIEYSSAPVSIGGHSNVNGGVRGFDGQIDEVGIYDRALSAAEIAALFHAGTGSSSVIHTLSLASALPSISDPVVIDGYSQPGAKANTRPPGEGWDSILKIEINGSNAGAGGDGLVLLAGAGGSTIRGLVFNRFADDGIFVGPGSGSLIEGNFVGTDLTGRTVAGAGGRGIAVSGGTNNTIRGNLIGGRGSNAVEVNGASATGNKIQGNLIGLDITGATPLRNSGAGVALMQNSSGTIVGGGESAYRNVIADSQGDGVIIGGDSTGNVISGNYIGTDVTGVVPIGNKFCGVVVFTGNNRVGGPTPAERNIVGASGLFGVALQTPAATGNMVQGNSIGIGSDGVTPVGNLGTTISGTGQGVFIENASGNSVFGNTISSNAGSGILFKGSSSNNIVQGNFIGTTVGGVGARPNPGGIEIGYQAANNTIGGALFGQGNVIAYNTFGGVGLFTTGSGNRILGNSIFGNGSLGIDLFEDGVTPNDDDDPDAGPNGVQNYPILTDVSHQGGVTIEGTLNSTAGTTFRLEFFASRRCGDGEQFLGFKDVTTDAGGDASFSATFGLNPGVRRDITATATAPDGSTSEFSACIELNSADADWLLYR